MPKLLSIFPVIVAFKFDVILLIVENVISADAVVMGIFNTMYIICYSSRNNGKSAMSLNTSNILLNSQNIDLHKPHCTFRIYVKALPLP